LEEIAEKERKAISLTRYSDPNSLLGGFTRGGREQREKDAADEKMLKELGGLGPQELPQDLIKFLNDVGPVKRELDKSLTSSRIVSEIAKEGIDEQVFFDREDEKERERRRQRWRSRNLYGEGDGVPVAALPSSAQEEEMGEMGPSHESQREANLLLSDEEISALLRDSGEVMQGKNESDKELLHLVTRYISHPVIMVDTDEDRSLIGAYKENVADLKTMGLSLHVEPVVETQAKNVGAVSSSRGSSENIEAVVKDQSGNDKNVGIIQ